MAGISSQFIYVFLEGVPEGGEEAWAALPRLEHAPPTPMNDSQRRNFLERQGLRLADGDHAREAAAMVRIVDDTVQGSRGPSPAASALGEVGDAGVLAASPDGAAGPAVGQHQVQQPFGEGFALAQQFGHAGMPAFQAPMLQFRGGYHPVHPFAAGTFAGSGFRTIHPGLVGAHPLGQFSVGGYSNRQQLQPFESAPYHLEQAPSAADSSAPEASVAIAGGATAQWQSQTPTNRRAGAVAACPPAGNASPVARGSHARAPPGSSLLNALLSSARVARPRRGVDSEVRVGGVASEVAEPATAPAAVRHGDSAVAGGKQPAPVNGARVTLAGLSGRVAQRAAPEPAATTPCVLQLASGRRVGAAAQPSCVSASGSPHQLVGGTQGAFPCGKGATSSQASPNSAQQSSKVAVSLVPVTSAEAAGWDASDAGCCAAAIHTARSTPLGAPASAPAVVRPSAKRPCLASQRPSVAEAVHAELLALPAGWSCAPASAPPQLRGDCHAAAMAIRSPNHFAKTRAQGDSAKRHCKAPCLEHNNGRIAGRPSPSGAKAGHAAQDNDSREGTGASDFHKASRARRQRRALKRRRDCEAAAEAVFAPEPQPRFACGASLAHAVSASLGPGACSAFPASVLCSAMRSDDAGRAALMEVDAEAAISGAVCDHTPTAHARSTSRLLGAVDSGGGPAGQSLSDASDLGNGGGAATSTAHGSAQAAVHAALSCRLCDGLLVNAASLGCGHTFCFTCAAEALMRHCASPACPTCSAPATALGTRVLPLSDHEEVQALALEAGTATPRTAAVERLLQRVTALDVLVATTVAALGSDARLAFSRRVEDHEAHAAKRGLGLSTHRGRPAVAAGTIGASAAMSPAGARSSGGSSGVFGRSPLRCSILGAGRPDDEVMAEEAASLRPLERIAHAVHGSTAASHSQLPPHDDESDDDESDDNEADFEMDPSSAGFAFEDPAPTHAFAGYDAPLSNGTSRASSDPGLVAAVV